MSQRWFWAFVFKELDDGSLEVLQSSAWRSRSQAREIATFGIRDASEWATVIEGDESERAAREQLVRLWSRASEQTEPFDCGEGGAGVLRYARRDENGKPVPGLSFRGEAADRVFKALLRGNDRVGPTE